MGSKVYYIPEGVTGRECNTCKIWYEFKDYRKGNAKYGYKSECKYCQNERRRKYRKFPGVRERELKQEKDRRAKEPKYIKTIRYLKRKPYYEQWKKENPEKYRASEKSKSHTRRSRLSALDKLETSSIVSLEHYNISYFNKPNFVCEYCLTEIMNESYHLDHIVPISKDGTNSLSNLAITCLHCNCSKSDKLLDEWSPDKVEYIKNRKLI